MFILWLFLNLIAIALAQHQPTSATSQQQINIRSNDQPLSYPATPFHDYNKAFYTYSAPETEFEDAEAKSIIDNGLQKALRVVFIKTPENNGLEKAALQLAKSAMQQQTVIYVLNKQSDIANLANQLNSVRENVEHKPEVHFVKYRTEEDAEIAKNTIQSQYDALPGKPASHYAGSAPVLDFITKRVNQQQPTEVSKEIRPAYVAEGANRVQTGPQYRLPTLI